MASPEHRHPPHNHPDRWPDTAPVPGCGGCAGPPFAGCPWCLHPRGEELPEGSPVLAGPPHVWVSEFGADHSWCRLCGPEVRYSLKRAREACPARAGEITAAVRLLRAAGWRAELEQCPEVTDAITGSRVLECVRPAGHAGSHRSEDGTEWRIDCRLGPAQAHEAGCQLDTDHPGGCDIGVKSPPQPGEPTWDDLATAGGVKCPPPPPSWSSLAETFIHDVEVVLVRTLRAAAARLGENG